MTRKKESIGGIKEENSPEFPLPEDVMRRELVVIAKHEAGLRATREGVASMELDVSPLKEFLESEGVTLQPLFGVREERLENTAARLASEIGAEVPDLSVYYRVEAPDERLDSLAEQLRELEVIEAAYVKPPAEIPEELQINVMTPLSEEPPVHTPDFTSRQGYLNPAPEGIDARYAWTLPGGSGAGVSIIDIEGAWNFSHEDLLQNQGGVVGGTQSSDLHWRNHGTAVVGEFGGDRNSFGITGISPDARVGAISIFGLGTSQAIVLTANKLKPGDIILIELHRPGPRHNFQGRGDQEGYIAIEWWPDDFAAIHYATKKGIIVVEAAGNGAENLDDPLYEQRPPNFPSTWTNPFNRANRDSGAIVAGAGAPPPGTHGHNHGPDRSRLGFSNYGKLIDAQGWGREVTSTGYGDLQGGSNQNEWYTDRFSGTSSASPIVVGAVACIQGILYKHSKCLTPATARALLRATGSPQQDAPGRPRTQRIGNRPNLRQMVEHLLPRVVPLYRYWNPGIGDHFYTTNWGELGKGRHGWKYEGIQCYVRAARKGGTVPLYRYWNPGIGDHFYTTNWRELGRGRHGWKYEGIQCYVHTRPQPGVVPLYRYWNPRIGDHFYTTNWRELGRGRYGYQFEGVQCFVYTQPVIGTPAVEEPSAEVMPETFATEFEPSAEMMPEMPETFATEFEPSAEMMPETFATEFGAPESFQVEDTARLEGITININVQRGAKTGFPPE